MIATMEEHDVASTEQEPRWKAAGPPYLLTRQELIEELGRRGVHVTDRQLKSWATYGLLPSPVHRAAPGFTDGRVRALHPFWLIGLIPNLLQRLRAGHTIDKVLPYAKNQWGDWESREKALLSHEVSGFDLDEEHRLFMALSSVVNEYMRHTSKTTGRVLSAELNTLLEDGSRRTIAFGGYRPGDEDNS